MLPLSDGNVPLPFSYCWSDFTLPWSFLLLFPIFISLSSHSTPFVLYSLNLTSTFFYSSSTSLFVILSYLPLHPTFTIPLANSFHCLLPCQQDFPVYPSQLFLSNVFVIFISFYLAQFIFANYLYPLH